MVLYTDKGLLGLMNEISPIENRYLCTVRDVHEFTKTHYGVELIDHDFGPDHNPNMFEPGSLNDCIRRVDGLHEAIPDDQMNNHVMRRNLRSIGMELGVLSGKLVIGENLDFLDYVKQTMSVRPAMVPETSEEDGADSLENQRQDIEALVEELGYHYDPADRNRFNAEFAIPADKMQTTVEGFLGTSKSYVASIVGSSLIKGLDIVKFWVVNDKDTWQAHFGTDKRRHFLTKFNSNPLLKIVPLLEEAIQVHEMAHGVSSTNKKMEIARGRLSEAMGILLAASPSYFHEEVAARAVEEKLLADRSQSSPLAMYVYKMVKYWNDVGNNMIIMANSGSSETEVARYGMDRLPFDEPGKVKKDAELYAHNLVYKTVFAVDSQAVRAGRRIAALPKDEMAATVVRICTEPVDTAELMAG